jgi:PAS domain S-box-containing protein
MKIKNTFTPERIILILAITIFVFEGILMYLLTFFHALPLWFEGIIDSAILTIAVFPVLYYFVFRPMIKEINHRTLAEKALLKNKSELEDKVEERTGELSDINEELKSEIHERIQVELELQKLARAINNSPASVVITDSKGNIEYINPKFTRLTGYTKSEAIGQNPRILKSGHQTEDFYKDLWDTITSGKEWRGEFCNLKKNGDLYWESASIAPVLNENGETTHFVAVKEDITEQRAAREMLKKNKDDLQIYSEQLKDSNDMKELLLDIITHDLKNPAGVIDGFTGLLLEQDSTDQMTQSIKKSSDTLLKVIDSATALAGVAMGESIEKQEINLSQMLQDVKSEFEQIAKHAEIEIKFHPPGDIYINANPILSEVFKNYLSNAIKYAKDGKQIILEIKEEDESIHVYVKDFGKTIAEENREAIFLRQTRLDSDQKGRGLGLAIVKRIADAHGGKVWVEPNEPTGNRFCFEIPK